MAMAGKQETDVAITVSDAKGEPGPQRRRGELRVFGQWCKGCGLCIAFCPRQVFVAGEDGHPLVVYPERCTACYWCTEHCPDFAILVRPGEDGKVWSDT